MADGKVYFVNVLICTCQFDFSAFFHIGFPCVIQYSANYFCSKTQINNHVYLPGEQ